MGCDIHLFAEAKKIQKKENLINILQFWKKPEVVWQTIENWEEPLVEGSFYKVKNRFYSNGRNYNLFCALCGVRRHQFIEPHHFISEPKGIPEDSCEEIKQQIEYWDSDGHSHNYNTLKELKEFDWSLYGNTTKDFLDEVIPKLEAQQVPDTDVRIVYFFDN